MASIEKAMPAPPMKIIKYSIIVMDGITDS